MEDFIAFLIFVGGAFAIVLINGLLSMLWETIKEGRRVV